jgi:hypothetical protein
LILFSVRRSNYGQVPDARGPAFAGSLALLRGAPPGAAEATIALLPYQRRCELAASGVVDCSRADAERAAAIRVTEYGHGLIRDS